MHHMGIALDDHQVRDLHGADFGHPPQVVSTQVDQHQVFRSLLRVMQQFVRQLSIFLLGLATRFGPGDGAQRGDIVFKTHHGLRGRSNQNRVAKVEEKKVG